MPAKPKSSGTPTKAKPTAKKVAPPKAAAKKVIAPKVAPAKSAPKGKTAPVKAPKKTVSPQKPAKAAKPTPKAPANKVSKNPVAKPLSKPSKAAPKKAVAKSSSKAVAPKPKATPAKATKPQLPTVKKAAPKASAPAKSTPKAAPKTKAPAKPAPKAPASKATTDSTPPAKKTTGKAKPEVVIQEAPPAPKRAKKEAIAPPTTFGKMPRRRIDDEMEVTIEPIKGPVKMTPFLIRQKQRLVELRDSYLNLIEGVANETIRQRPEDGAGSAFGMHQADAGSDAYDRDFALSLLGKEQDALYEINEALKRIDQGVYGICEMSKEKISHERLEALPFTRYTVVCQERIERQQMGGRYARPVRSLFGLDDASETSADASDEDDSDSLDSSRD
jgi:RNA polymerase-binding transcription factor DksA